MFLFSILFTAIAGVTTAATWTPLPHTESAPVRNVIIMIPDGTGFASLTLAREFSGKPLFLDSILRGAAETVSANSIVTDSAAAGTALSTGHRTTNGTVALSPDAEPHPMASISELAQAMGKSVGVVTSDELFGATPSAFSAHTAHRGEGAALIKQQAHQGFEVFMGGGRRLMKPQGRPDKEDLIALVKEQGYTYVETAEELKAVKEGKIWGCFNDNVMTPIVTRLSRPTDEPTLKEMTVKAIEILAQNPNGFFLMVEGAQPDKGNHISDAAYATHEVLDFDAAVEAAVAFARQTPGTVILLSPDHETGGLTLPKDRKVDRVGTMKKMQLSAPDMLKGLSKNSSDSEIAARVLAHWSLTLSDTDKSEIRKRLNGGHSVVRAVCNVISSRHLGVEYSSGNHTGVEVPYWGFGPQLPVGFIRNTTIPRTAAQLFGGDLDALTKEKYVKVEGGETDLSDKTKPVLILNGKRIPADTNYALTADGKKEPLGGLAVYIRTSKVWYLPAKALASK